MRLIQFRQLIAITAGLVLMGLTPLLAQGQATPAAQTDPAAAIQAGVDWLMSQQRDDGAWAGFSAESDPGATIDVVLALAAARNAGVEVDLTSAVAYLAATGAEYAALGGGQAAKLVMAAVAVGEDPTTFAGLDSVELMLESYDPSTDMYGAGMYDTALVSLALGAVDNDPPDIIIESIEDRQMKDGSWAFDGTTEVGNGDTNTTAIIIQALVATEHTEGDMILHGIEYLQRSQLPQGFPFQTGPGATPDANSTALVVQALIAAGEDPASQAWQNVAGSLLAFRNESGSFSYQLDPKDENLYATLQVIPALASQPFPIRSDSDATTPVALATCTPEQLEATPVTDADLPCAA
jgi:hypothetical protein